jgi:hypothetical protein
MAQQPPSRWRISVDDSVTLAFGDIAAAATAAAARAPAPAPNASDLSLAPPLRGAAPRFVAVGWASARSRFALRNPSDVLCSELLCAVFGALPLRDRLACAAVCRAWRRELAPAAAARNAHAWTRADLSVAAFPLTRTLDADALRAWLVASVLPRFGPHVRELSLRGTEVDDAMLALVLAACPHLSLLDVRHCDNALTWSEDDNTYGFMDLLLAQYERAAPQQRFTLLQTGSGIRDCEHCGYFCPNAQRAVLNTLEMALAWPIKPPLPGAQDASAPLTGTWLRCDVAPCPMHGLLPEAKRANATVSICSACSLQVCSVRMLMRRASTSICKHHLRHATLKTCGADSRARTRLFTPAAMHVA